MTNLLDVDVRGAGLIPQLRRRGLLLGEIDGARERALYVPGAGHCFDKANSE